MRYHYVVRNFQNEILAPVVSDTKPLRGHQRGTAGSLRYKASERASEPTSALITDTKPLSELLLIHPVVSDTKPLNGLLLLIPRTGQYLPLKELSQTPGLCVGFYEGRLPGGVSDTKPLCWLLRAT